MAGLLGARASGFRAGSRKVASAIVVAALASLMVVGTASATVDFRDRYSFDYAFTYPCGSVEISVVGHSAGTFHLRVGTGKFETAFFAHDNYSFRETHTNPDGDFLVISGDGLFQETRAVPLGGNLFQFSSHNSGRPFIVTDENGDVVVRDRGTISATIIFDTTGDNLPGGNFIEDVSFRVSGPHDGLGFDTCDILG
jgi:hypothetical protein